MRTITHLRTAAAILAVAVAVATPAVTMAQAAPAKPHVKNIVLVHGAWGDGSGWQGVYKILVKDGYTVSIVTHSNESLASDVADTQRVLDRQDGAVILVGHSYGGAIISEAGVDSGVATRYASWGSRPRITRA
jgi:pimeloyl-ACP methyl ester carboxylesterase